MAVEMLSFRLHEECVGRGDRTRGRLHAKRSRFRSCYRVRSPVSVDQLTCIINHAPGTVTKFNVIGLYFYFSFCCKSENVICCGNEYG